MKYKLITKLKRAEGDNHIHVIVFKCHSEGSFPISPDYLSVSTTTGFCHTLFGS